MSRQRANCETVKTFVWFWMLEQKKPHVCSREQLIDTFLFFLDVSYDNTQAQAQCSPSRLTRLKTRRMKWKRDVSDTYRIHVYGHVGLRGGLVVCGGAGVHRGRDLDQTRLPWKAQTSCSHRVLLNGFSVAASQAHYVIICLYGMFKDRAKWLQHALLCLLRLGILNKV